jgi:DNA-directed RNA polymerase subunit L
MAQVTVDNISIDDMTPKVKDPEARKLLPSTLFPERLSFNLHGVNNAVSNAIRRTVLCELLVSALYADSTNVTTNDEFIIHEMITKRLRMIPIDQYTPLDATFELIVENSTSHVKDIKSAEIRIVNPGRESRSALRRLPFNETYTLFTLAAGKSLRIPNIRINQAYGYENGDGMHAVAFNAVSIAVDQKPINLYIPNDDGLPSSLSDPRVWRIAFNTNGSMPAKKIVIAACDNLIFRISSISDLLDKIVSSGNEYILTINGESDTIGNLFMKTITDLFPDIIAITYSASSVIRSITIRMRCNEDINVLYNDTIKHLVKMFGIIKSYFE